MTKNELYDKYLKLSVWLENMYRDSNLDITDEQYERAKQKILDIAYLLGFAKLSKKNVAILESRYDRWEKELVAKMI